MTKIQPITEINVDFRQLIIDNPPSTLDRAIDAVEVIINYMMEGKRTIILGNIELVNLGTGVLIDTESHSVVYDDDTKESVVSVIIESGQPGKTVDIIIDPEEEYLNVSLDRRDPEQDYIMFRVKRFDAKGEL